ncbi:gliding motility-associated C-terminal domain-containing protein [Tenacibaculum sp. nBUS_03]|uniref:Ig-like domain-containing protein n=1 Tax=Tenacibaculum sp. nBUS_03 TaxID=3395320 RepID=UPI003EBFCEE1
MSEKIAKSVKILLVIWLLFQTLGLFSQALLSPEFIFSSACGDEVNKSHDITFKIAPGTLFNSDNQFFVQMSDDNGVFPSNTTENRVSAAIVGKNETFQDISASFQLPDNTFGTGYKIRMVATSPVATGPESIVFSAYDMVKSILWINDNKSTDFICGSGSLVLKLNTDKEGVYQWFRNRTISVGTTTDPEITVNEPGTYEARIDYGECGVVNSILINVVRISTSDAQIKGSSPVEICADETHTFEATTNNTALTYRWYKDDELVLSSNSNTYTTPNTGQFGIYRLEIEANGCISNSQEVELKQKTEATFTVNIEGTQKTVWLPNETRLLKIEIVPSSTPVTVQWFKVGDPNPLPGKSGLEINATEAGVYYAVATDSSGSCPFSVESDKFTLLATKSINTVIKSGDDYVSCDSDKTLLTVASIKATGSDDLEYDLSPEQIAILNYQWYKDAIIQPGKTLNEYEVDSYLDNGEFELEVSSGLALSNKSNKLDVNLTIATPDIASTSSSNALCDGETITLTVSDIVTGFTYKWFKDSVELTVTDPKTLEISETGEYKLQISGFDCVKDVTPINIIPFDDSAVLLYDSTGNEIGPSGKVVLLSGQPTTIRGEGGNTYQWEDSDGNPLSSTNIVSVTEAGFYTLIATVDRCEVRKTVEVVEQDDQIIVPNVVSPNTVDGINDTWKLSNRYAFQPSVTVTIYSSDGKEVLMTKEYKNDWPSEDLGNQRIFYYKITREDKLVKAGSISVLD